MFFGVWNKLRNLPINRGKSQLICEKHWEQVIHILNLGQKYLKFSTK